MIEPDHDPFRSWSGLIMIEISIFWSWSWSMFMILANDPQHYRPTDSSCRPFAGSFRSTMTGSTRVYVSVWHCPLLSYKSILLWIWVAMLFKRSAACYKFTTTILPLSLSQPTTTALFELLNWFDLSPPLRQLWLCSNVRPHETFPWLVVKCWFACSKPRFLGFEFSWIERRRDETNKTLIVNMSPPRPHLSQ